MKIKILYTLIFTLLLSNINAQTTCNNVSNFQFEEITSNYLEVSWSPNLSAIQYELNFYVNGILIHSQIEPATSTNFLLYTTLSSSDDIEVDIITVCGPGISSDPTILNTVTDVFIINVRPNWTELCKENMLNNRIIYEKITGFEYDVKCLCSQFENFKKDGNQFLAMQAQVEHDDKIKIAFRDKFKGYVEKCKKERKIRFQLYFDYSEDRIFKIINDSQISDEILYFFYNGNLLKIAINSTSNERIKVGLFDMIGKKVFEDNFETSITKEDKLKVNISNINKGIYFYQIIIGNQTYSGKVKI